MLNWNSILGQVRRIVGAGRADKNTRTIRTTKLSSPSGLGTAYTGALLISLTSSQRAGSHQLPPASPGRPSSHSTAGNVDTFISASASTTPAAAATLCASSSATPPPAAAICPPSSAAAAAVCGATPGLTLSHAARRLTSALANPLRRVAGLAEPAAVCRTSLIPSAG